MNRLARFFGVSLLAMVVLPAQAINENFINGVYWNPQDAPSMGFAISVQKGVLFGAIYGYTSDGSPSFITLIGGPDTSTSFTDYTGSVFVTEKDRLAFPSTQVGTFTWEVAIVRGQPAAKLSISGSPILRGDLELVRLSFNELDEIDAVSESEWISYFRSGGQLFAAEYSFGAPVEDNGMTVVPVIQRFEDPGTIIHGENNLYGLLAPFSRGGTANGGVDVFYSCTGTSTQLFCLVWLLAPGQVPSDFPGTPAGLVSTGLQLDRPQPTKALAAHQQLRELQLELYQADLATIEPADRFEIKDIMSVFWMAVAARDRELNP